MMQKLCGSWGLSIFLLISFTQFVDPKDTNSKNAAKRLSHKPLYVDDHNLKLLCPDRDWGSFNETLSKIVIPRVVGTPGHAHVRQYIKDTMSTLKWHVETDAFKADTPNMGTLAFENIIATLNPASERHLVLACHFDSKYFPDQEFLGASDSAVPCAMLLDLATVLAPYLEQNRVNSEVSLQLLFLDGEEAFLEWSATDSIYGARHLAAKWEKENKLDKIDLFVLLDLLGLPDPQFYSFFRETEASHAHLVDIEQRLSDSGHLVKHGTGGVIGRRTSNEYFQAQGIQSYIEDDHIPFLKRGVPILHVIPVPFPSEWHTMNDSPAAVDHTTTENLNKIFRVFVTEYLHLVV